MNYILTLAGILLTICGFAQNGIITGKVLNSISNEPIPFATVAIAGTNLGTSTDENGVYRIEKLQPGIYNISASVVGFDNKTIFDIEVTNSKPAEIDFSLTSSVTELKEVEIKDSPFVKKEESLISLRNINATEISRYPGGNRDISKVIQSLPGVASTPNYRNDIIIRGGSPNENRFYVDDIETPNINHFATQGSSGGPQGMINVDYIREVLFYSSTFPADRNNALSSVLEFSLKEGRTDRLGGKLTVGASDFALTAEGPAGKDATFIFSARRSYLQFLFKVIGLPFLPVYNDFLLKYKIKLSPKDELSFIGLGAIDDSRLNTDLQETGDESQKYILGYLPEQHQWNYTNGFRYVHYRKKSFSSIVLSRNFLNNEALKYMNNIKISENKIQDYASQEIENKLRIENTSLLNTIKIKYGFLGEYFKYNNSTFNKITVNDTVQTVDFESTLDGWEWGVFAQVSKSFLKHKFHFSLGARADGCSFNNSTNSTFRQLSPRASISYSITPDLSFVANFGLYYQLPSFTVLGYRENNILVNKINNVTYMLSRHFVAGFDFISKNNLKLNAEGFFKIYDKYPFSVSQQISLANLGSDFGVIGNEEVISTSKGRAYGFEFLAQQKLYKGFYGIFTYTYVRSEFMDLNRKYIPSSWDSRQIINLIAGKSFKHNWEAGIKWKFSLGMPYTPYDFDASRTIANWNVNRQGIYDWKLLNANRKGNVHGLDLRIDKKYYRKNLTFNFYVDIQNVYNFKTKLPSYLNVVYDSQGKPVIDSQDNTRYVAKYLDSYSGSIIPTLGIIIEY